MVFPSNTQETKQTNKQNKNQPTNKKSQTIPQPPKKVSPHIPSAGKDGWNWVLEKNLIVRMYANLHLLYNVMGPYIYNENVIGSS